MSLSLQRTVLQIGDKIYSFMPKISPTENSNMSIQTRQSKQHMQSMREHPRTPVSGHRVA